MTGVARSFFPDEGREMPAIPAAWQLSDFLDGATNADPYNLTSGILTTYHEMRADPERYDPEIIEMLEWVVQKIHWSLRGEEKSRLQQMLLAVEKEGPSWSRLYFTDQMEHEPADLALKQKLEDYLNRPDIHEPLAAIATRFLAFDKEPQKHYFGTSAADNWTIFVHPEQSDGSPSNAALTILQNSQREILDKILDPQQRQFLKKTATEIFELALMAPAYTSPLKHIIISEGVESKIPFNKQVTWQGSDERKALIVKLCDVFNRHHAFLYETTTPFANPPIPITPDRRLLDDLNYALEKAQGVGIQEIDLEYFNPSRSFLSLVQGLRVLSTEPAVGQREKLKIQPIFEEIRKIVEDTAKANKTGDVAELANEILALLPPKGRGRGKTERQEEEE